MYKNLLILKDYNPKEIEKYIVSDLESISFNFTSEWTDNELLHALTFFFGTTIMTDPYFDKEFSRINKPFDLNPSSLESNIFMKLIV